MRRETPSSLSNYKCNLEVKQDNHSRLEKTAAAAAAEKLDPGCRSEETPPAQTASRNTASEIRNNKAAQIKANTHAKIAPPPSVPYSSRRGGKLSGER